MHRAYAQCNSSAASAPARQPLAQAYNYRTDSATMRRSSSEHGHLYHVERGMQTAQADMYLLVRREMSESSSSIALS